MKKQIFGATLVAAVAAVAVALASTGSPGPGADEKVDGDVAISNTETVQVLMNADGKVNAERVYEQLELKGNGSVDVSNPVSTDGLRNLDGFGRIDTKDGKQRVKADVDGTKRFRTVSNFDGKLPLDISIDYEFDGKKVEPGDVVGKSGDLKVRYTVKNVTGETEDVQYPDGQGGQKKVAEDVVVPIVGSLTTTLPPTFTRVRSDEANAAGDGRGGTQLSFTMTLIPPIGSDTAEFGYTAKVDDAIIPKASLSALPVNPLESPSFSGGASSYAGGAQTGRDLTAGASEIDDNVLKLRDGASDLVKGILQLSDGADELSAGLTDEAAPGARRLADGSEDLDDGAQQVAGGTSDLNAGAKKLGAGAGQVSDGASKLNSGATKLNKGAGDLAGGLEEAKAGGPALLEGVAKLKAGSQKIDAGLATLNESVVPGANGINAGASSLLSALDGRILPALEGALQAITGANNAAGSLGDDVPQKAIIQGALTTATTAVTGARNGLRDETPRTGFKGGLIGIRDGGKAIADGVDAQTSEAAKDTDGTIRNGIQQVIAGLTELQEKGGDLADGLNKLSAGANELSAGTKTLKGGTGDLSAGAKRLNTGTGDLQDGTGKLADGASRLEDGTGRLSTGATDLADGLGIAASGSDRLAAGLGQAAESSPALPKGAARLSKEGTSQLINAGDGTAQDFGLKYALLEAGAKRAGSAQPYGSPEGATELTAYKVEIAGDDGAGSKNLQRGIAAAVLLAAAGAVVALRRKLAA